MDRNRTLIIGASENPDRYANMAAKRLLKHQHEIALLGRRKGQIDGIVIEKEQQKLNDIDTITLYIGPQHQEEYTDYIINLKPRRVIFNPGTWNADLIEKLNKEKIETVDACTLVMLSAGTY